MARNLYDGAALARLMAAVTLAFSVAPVLAPLIGRVLTDAVLSDFLRLGDDRDGFFRRTYAYIGTSLAAALCEAGPAPAPRGPKSD